MPKSWLWTWVFFLLTACSPAPDAHDIHGKAIQLQDYRGKWVLVNYWAPWCKPCLQELPDFSRLQKDYPTQVHVLAVSFEPLTPAQIRAFMQPLASNLQLLATFPLAKLGITRIEALPVTFVISPQGRLVQTLHGPQQFQSLVQALQLG